MAFLKILCPTDFSTGAGQALRIAARLASDVDAELVIAHVWYVPPPATFAGEYSISPEAMAEIADDAKHSLELAVREARTAGVQRVSSRLLNGVPWGEITRLAEEEQFDLCVIGTHGRTGLARILVGSVAEKVLRHSPCSVLVVRRDAEPKPFRHALVPVDFSASSELAAELAAAVVEEHGWLTLLHVVELPSAYTGTVASVDVRRHLETQAQEALARLGARLESQTTVRVEARTRRGHAGAQALAALDDDHSVDVVVMGSHGRTGIERVLLGSVAEKVVRHARCPVLVARRSR